MNTWLGLESIERHPGRVFAGIGCLFAVAYLTAQTVFPREHGRVLDGDAIQYYAYLRSIVMDRDLDFTNDYELLYRHPADGADNIWLTSRTPLGRPTNLMSIGPALLWAPFFLATSAAVGLIHLLGFAVAVDGFAPPFPLSAGVAGIAYATVGAYLCFRACSLMFPARPAFWSALAAWLATPAVYYSVISPAYSHATSLFACALFVYVWLKHRNDTRLASHLWLGLLAGIAAVVRWQDGVIVLLPLAELARSVRSKRLSLVAAAARAGVMLAGAFVMVLPQFLAWQAIYGRLFLMPQGPGFIQWTRPAILSVLFSLRHGLFSWTPAVLVSAAGLIFLIRRDALVGWSAVAIVGTAAYVNASVIDWWAGEAFGARRFVGYTVFFALGLCALFCENFWEKRPQLMRWTTAALVVYNLLFLVQYQLFMRGFHDLAPYPETVRQVFVDRLILPFVVLRHWLSGA